MSGMNLKTLCTFFAISAVFCSALFGSTLNLSGKVTSLSVDQIGLLSGKDDWTIMRTKDTKVTSGKLAVGSTVTIQCLSTDAHKNE